jgi:hypothetical protein
MPALDGLAEVRLGKLTLIPFGLRCTEDLCRHERFAERKFGRYGNHSPERSRPFIDNAAIKSQIDRYGDAVVRYIGSPAQDIYDTFGKFPGTIPSIGVAVYSQAHHIDLDFYDKFFKPGSYLDTHVDHQCAWHGAATSS